MRRLRTTSTRRLLTIVGAIAVLAITAGIAQAALSGDNPVPPSKPLNQAVVDAANAPKTDGITASVTFDNNLIPQGALPEGTASPLLSGAKGRLWLAQDGRFRVELQSQAGDAQIVSDGKTVTAYYASSNTAYRFTLPQRRAGAQDQGKGEHGPVTIEQVDKAIAKVSRHWTLSGADPTSTAGRPSYTLRISPKDDGGLLGAAEVAWDADNGTPLRAALYADGQDGPVLQLEATDITYGPVADSDLAVSPPADAKVVDVSGPRGEGKGPRGGFRHDGRGHQDQPQKSVSDVQGKVPFTLAAPDSVAGLPRQEVRPVSHGGKDTPGAAVVYGKGLGAIVVLEQDAKAKQADEAKAAAKAKKAGANGRDRGLDLPRINIDGATGDELATALGTVITFERDGVSYTVAGSVPPQAAEQAARDLR